MKVVVLGSHPDRSKSMNKYALLLVESYRECGYDVWLMAPQRLAAIRKTARVPPRLAARFEELLVFPVSLLLSRQVLDADLIHIADHSDSPWRLALWRSKRVVVTCHDLIGILLARQDLAGPRTGVQTRLYQRLILASLRRIREVWCVSHATKSALVRLHRRAHASVVLNPVTTPPIRAAWSPLAQQYVVCVSSAEWRKARHRAVTAWARLRDSSGVDIELVMVGPYLTTAELSRMTPSLAALSEEIKYVTDISDSKLAEIYSGARLTLQLSLYEGFGWPVVESNVQGAPVLCSDIEVFHEIGPNNFFVGEDLRTSVPQWRSIWDASGEMSYRRGLAESSGDRYSMKVFVQQLRALSSDYVGPECSAPGAQGAPL